MTCENILNFQAAEDVRRIKLSVAVFLEALQKVYKHSILVLCILLNQIIVFSHLSFVINVWVLYRAKVLYRRAIYPMGKIAEKAVCKSVFLLL